MSLLVVSRPVWQPRDQAWLKQLRDRHGGATFDPALGPHLTLVFPADEVAEDAAVSHIHAVASGFAPFDAAFRAILPVKDSFSDDTYLYMVPDLGTASIIRLHDRLYTGSLAEALRLDLPYWPHITLGRFSSARIAKALADDLNNQEPELNTRIETVELFRWSEGAPASRVAEFVLGG